MSTQADSQRARILRDAALVLGALAAEERFYPLSENAANDVMNIARQLQGEKPIPRAAMTVSSSWTDYYARTREAHAVNPQLCDESCGCQNRK